MKLRLWYHCTTDNHGDTLAIKRRAPKIEKEPPTPRLCVAPSVAACFASRLFRRGQSVFVYRTPKKRKAIKPTGVWDQFITDEHWLIPPGELVLIDTIPLSVASVVQNPFREYHLRTKKGSSWKLRLLQYLRATYFVQHSSWERGYLEETCNHFGITENLLISPPAAAPASPAQGGEPVP